MLKVWSDQRTVEYMTCFDWLAQTAKTIGPFLEDTSASEVMAGISGVSIHRHSPDSVMAGVFDCLLGRVLLCASGYRIYGGMSVDA